MTRDLPQVFKKFSNIMSDVELVIELHKTTNKQAINKGLPVLNNTEWRMRLWTFETTKNKWNYKEAVKDETRFNNDYDRVARNSITIKGFEMLINQISWYQQKWLGWTLFPAHFAPKAIYFKKPRQVGPSIHSQPVHNDQTGASMMRKIRNKKDSPEIKTQNINVFKSKGA